MTTFTDETCRRRRYELCDQAECPIDWQHWHLRNEDGTSAGATLTITAEGREP